MKNLREEIVSFVDFQFINNEKVKKEIGTMEKFLSSLQYSVTKDTLDAFIIHLKDSIVASLLLYSEEKKISIENFQNKTDEIENMILKAIELSKMTFGYFISEIYKSINKT